MTGWAFMRESTNYIVSFQVVKLASLRHVVGLKVLKASGCDGITTRNVQTALPTFWCVLPNNIVASQRSMPYR